MSGACESQLSSALFDRLSSETYHVAFVDLMFNECGLALAAKLGTPAVGFGSASLQDLRSSQRWTLSHRMSPCFSPTFPTK